MKYPALSLTFAGQILALTLSSATALYSTPSRAEDFQSMLGVSAVEATTWRGAWQAGTPYGPGDVVEFEGSSYTAITNHTSNISTNTPSNPGLWTLLIPGGETGLTGPPGSATGPQGERGDEGERGIPGQAFIEAKTCPNKLQGFAADGSLVCAPPLGYWDITYDRLKEYYNEFGKRSHEANSAACTTECDERSTCLGFTWYETDNPDPLADNCKLFDINLPLDGTERLSDPGLDQDNYHFVSSASWNSLHCGHLDNDSPAVRLAYAQTLADNLPGVVETARRVAPDYIRGEEVDLPWLYAVQCGTFEAWELARTLGSTPARIEAARFESAKVVGTNESYLKYVAAYPDGTYADEIDDLRWEYALKVHLPRHYYSEYIGKCAGTPCKYRDEAQTLGDEFIYTVQAKVASIKAISAPGEWFEPDCIAASSGFVRDAGNNECGALEIFHNLAFGLNADINAQLNSGQPNEFNKLLGTFFTSSDVGDGNRFLQLNHGQTALPYGFSSVSTGYGTSYQNLKFGGFMFEVDATPEWCRYGTYIHPDLGEVWNDSCQIGYPPHWVPADMFYADFQQTTGWGVNEVQKINGIWSQYWNSGNRDLINNYLNPRDSFIWSTIKPIDIPLNTLKDDGTWTLAPTTRTQTVNFGTNEQIEITWEFIRSTESLYDDYIVKKGFKCDAPVPLEWQETPSNAYGPGFHIVNLTDYPLDISLGQVGPLYYDLINPGEVFAASTGAVWFTIKATTNLDGVPKDDVWSAVGPIVSFTAQALAGVMTGGTGFFGSGAAKAAIGAAIAEGTKQSAYTAFKLGSNYVALNAAKSTLTQFAGQVAEQAYSQEDLYASSIGQYAGPEWPFREAPEAYVVEGGPRAPCLDVDGNILFRPSTPMTITRYTP